jgi:hypothetical protein
MRSARPRRVATLALLVVSLAGVAAGAEGVLRLLARRPWQPSLARVGLPALQEPDPELGWRNGPGTHRVPSFSGVGPDVRFTFLADASRATSPAPRSGEPALLLGCSFTQGYAISDEDTFAWRLGERFPDRPIVNLGTAAYGTCQSLLVLERWLASHGPPRAVLYAFMEEHEWRNVASAETLDGIARRAGAGYAALPWCDVDARGALVRHPPRRHPEWPLRRSLALVALAERAWVKLEARPRTARRRAVTDALLRALRDRAAAAGAPLLVTHLWGSDESARHYARVAADAGIPFADCRVELVPALQVPGDGHPNAGAHRRYASCLAPFLGAALGR